MVELEARLQAWWEDRAARAFTLLRLAGLGGIIWAVANQQSRSVPGSRWAVPVLLAGASLGWVAWMATHRLERPSALTWGALALVTICGGLLVAYAPVATAFVAVASLGAAIAFPLERALPVAFIGFAAAMAATVGLGTKSSGEVVAEIAFAATAGLMAGFSRRQYQSRALQAEEVLAERTRADAERDRAAVLAERNRLGRELHDVLAHSLGALAVQLEAADALFEEGADDEKAQRLVHEARRLAVQGLEETRQAVHALRDEPLALVEQLASLAERSGARLEIDGTRRKLPPAAGLALYRTAQEGLTNARKHAPGAPVEIMLSFTPTKTELIVANGASSGGRRGLNLSSTGGGFGLRGLRERLELVDGQLEAHEQDGGWIVQAAVPA